MLEFLFVSSSQKPRRFSGASEGKVEKKPCFPSSPVFRCRQWCFPRRGKFFTHTSLSRLFFLCWCPLPFFAEMGRQEKKRKIHLSFLPSFFARKGLKFNKKNCICNIATLPHKDLNRAEIVQMWTEKGFFDAGDFERDFSLDLIFDFSAAEKRPYSPSLSLSHTLSNSSSSLAFPGRTYKTFS